MRVYENMTPIYIIQQNTKEVLGLFLFSFIFLCLEFSFWALFCRRFLYTCGIVFLLFCMYFFECLNKIDDIKRVPINTYISLFFHSF